MAESGASVTTEVDGPVYVVTINRPQRRNAVDRDAALQLAHAFREFESNDELAVAVLTGAGEHFCAGADLKAVAAGQGNRLEAEGDGPMGPSRMQLSKPVIAAVEGYCVAGGLELALWCDLRVAGVGAVFGVFCRRVGVPLIDGGTFRLPRLIGESRAMDLILTGRDVPAEEALAIGLVNRVAPDGGAAVMARVLARDLAALPQTCLRADRASVRAQFSLSEGDALAAEWKGGMTVVQAPDFLKGPTEFSSGK